jgi:hypothetical protein
MDQVRDEGGLLLRVSLSLGPGPGLLFQLFYWSAKYVREIWEWLVGYMVNAVIQDGWVVQGDGREIIRHMNIHQTKQRG